MPHHVLRDPYIWVEAAPARSPFKLEIFRRPRRDGLSVLDQFLSFEEIPLSRLGLHSNILLAYSLQIEALHATNSPMTDYNYILLLYISQSRISA